MTEPAKTSEQVAGFVARGFLFALGAYLFGKLLQDWSADR